MKWFKNHESPVPPPPLPEVSPEPLTALNDSYQVPKTIDELKLEFDLLLQQNEMLFTTFAQDASLGFVASDAFFIDFQKGLVHFDIKWFSEQGYTREQIIWAALHELSHFRDLAADPKNMLANFDRMRQRAAKTALKINSRLKALGKPVNPAGAEKAAYQYHHRFYNVLDDIYVNNLVTQRAPAYHNKGPQGETVRSLYRDKLFPPTDYRDQPRHVQFGNALLRQEMLPDDELQLSDDVADILENTSIIYQNKKYTIRAFIDTFLKPQSKSDTRPGQRYSLIQKYLEPIFDTLLEKDLEEWTPPENQSQQSDSSGESKEQGGDDASSAESQGQSGKASEAEFPEQMPFEREYQRFDKKNPDQIRDTDVERFVKQKIEEEKKKSEEAVRRAVQEKQEVFDRAWCKEKDLSFDELKKFRAVEAQIKAYLDDLTILWTRIKYGASLHAQRVVRGGARSGHDLDVPGVIKQWPAIASGHYEDQPIMRQHTSESVEVKKPKRIRVRVLADSSASMNTEDRIKILAQEQAVVLILSSLHEFNMHLDEARTVNPDVTLRVETELWKFDTESVLIKSSGHGRPDFNERVAMIEALSEIDAEGWGTDDAGALKAIQSRLLPDERAQIQAGELMEMVFVFTDGGSNDPDKMRTQIKALERLGVIVRGFQIGRVDEDEQVSFIRAWNSGPEKHGMVIGEDLSTLVPAVADALRENLDALEI